jgi:hypothetical protein
VKHLTAKKPVIKLQGKTEIIFITGLTLKGTNERAIIPVKKIIVYTLKRKPINPAPS